MALPPAHEKSSFYFSLYLPSPPICCTEHASVPALSSTRTLIFYLYLACSLLFILSSRIISGIGPQDLPASVPTLTTILLFHAVTTSLPLLLRCSSEMSTLVYSALLCTECSRGFHTLSHPICTIFLWGKGCYNYYFKLWKQWLREFLKLI